MIPRRYSLSIALTLKALLRLPAYWVPTLLFPVMLFGVIGSQMPDGLQTSLSMASFAAYAVMGVGFFQFGVSIALDRESHWERFRRTLPGAIGPRIAAQLAVATLFALAAVLLVILFAFAVLQPDAGAVAVVRLILASLLIAAPFTLFGVALGYLTSAKSAVPVANLVFLPLAYLGGLWTPPHRLPDAIASLSQWLPTRHAGEIVWSAVGPQAFPWFSLLVLALYTAGFAALAAWAYNRDERKRYS